MKLFWTLSEYSLIFYCIPILKKRHSLYPSHLWSGYIYVVICILSTYLLLITAYLIRQKRYINNLTFLLLNTQEKTRKSMCNKWQIYNWWLPDDYLMTTQWLPGDCQMTAWPGVWLLVMTVTGRSNKFGITDKY